jgi:hypothetical protein
MDVPVGLVHQMEALEDSELFEFQPSILRKIPTLSKGVTRRAPHPI